MAIIKRRNILDLIGKNRGKYHSCILTCYSFNFSFFEEQVLPILRTSNIKNVNVLADGKILEAAQDRTTGHEFSHQKNYSFQSVYHTGVFHPKIMLLTGVKHGLLFIGSGNLTSSGLSTNDEIWSAFHLNTVENENASLFGEAWLYLQSFLQESYGFTSQKINWIKKYSPWLAALPTNSDGFEHKKLKQKINFISNSKTGSIFQKLVARVPKEKLKSITIISPFYDQAGALLEALYDNYLPPTFNCIIDADYGTFPVKMNPKIADHINFYDWKECKNDFDNQVNRLHAKIFHFVYSSGDEYIIIGSANATVAAFGTISKDPVNHEAGILIYRSINKNWLEDLGVHIPKEPIEVNRLSSNGRSTDNSRDIIKTPNKIIYSELRGNEINIYLKKPLPNIEGRVRILSRHSLELENLSFKSENNNLRTSCKNSENVFKICIVNEAGDRISNFSIVHRFEELAKSNPDPEQQKLDNLFSGDLMEGGDVTKLLQYVDFNWADEPSVTSQTNSRNRNSHTTNERVSIEKEYQLLNENEFNTVSEEILLRQAGILGNPTIRIAEFLAVISSKFTRNDTFKESEEQKLLADVEQKEEFQVSSGLKINSNAEKEINAIVKYFTKLEKQYFKKLDKFYLAQAMTVLPEESITIRSLSNILIALHIVQIFHGKKYIIDVEEDNQEGHEQRESNYLIDGDLSTGVHSVKGFLLDVLGKFLLLAASKMKKYEYDILNQKMDSSRNKVLSKSIFIILNLKWTKSELPYRDSLLLNTLYFINSFHLTESNQIKGLLKRIKKEKSIGNVSCWFKENLREFENEFLPTYLSWSKKFRNQETKKSLIKKTDELGKLAIIFNNKIGFNHIYEKGIDAEKLTMTFMRPGYEYYEEDRASLWCDVVFPGKCIVYE